MRILLLAVMVTVVTGCAAPAPYEQKIEGIIFKGGAPATNVKVRFLSEYPEESCEIPGLEATTDQAGKFIFSQKYILSNRKIRCRDPPLPAMHEY